ncbi:LapA family protein [Acidithiobacillus montserratensis]|uniref:LapA family protein n=1 Tax=Acidithiobacillus montserratensis TaxID=2729135 RepID=A0ACD5HEE5_9PROT|nr:LapA family protein [Acidithiobacillus montserratensis]MBN2678734.1 LapA family protein [Acidithiobacillaceae bacterium]MBU2747243.1 LapA family protein [Acidithiobacillus montserratensis]
MWVVISLIIAALAVIFAVQNNVMTSVHFFSWTFAQSQGVILLCGFVAGFIASMLIYLPTHIRNKLKIRRHERRLGELEGQLNEERGKREYIEKEHAAALRIQKSNGMSGSKVEN